MLVCTSLTSKVKYINEVKWGHGSLLVGRDWLPVEPVKQSSIDLYHRVRSVLKQVTRAYRL